jgi:uncharacterized protein (DUF433 family)
MGGTPVFPGTRVPVQTLLDYIEAGDTIDEFLRGFPTVTRQHVVAFLERAATLAVREATTIAAMKEARRGGLASFDSAEELMTDLDAED